MGNQVIVCSNPAVPPMQAPLQIVFEHIEHTDTLEAAVRKEAQRSATIREPLAGTRMPMLRSQTQSMQPAANCTTRSGSSRAM